MIHGSSLNPYCFVILTLHMEAINIHCILQIDVWFPRYINMFQQYILTINWCDVINNKRKIILNTGDNALIESLLYDLDVTRGAVANWMKMNRDNVRLDEVANM